MKAQTIPTTSKMIRKIPIKIPANLLRLASGSSVAVDTNQEPGINPVSANMRTDILLTVSQTLPLNLLERISIIIIPLIPVNMEKVRVILLMTNKPT